MNVIFFSKKNLKWQKDVFYFVYITSKPFVPDDVYMDNMA
jgi:hypothetical protein